MWKSENWRDYEVIDTSAGEKLERWGRYILVRPDPQVIWSTQKRNPLWRGYDARYARSASGGGQWSAHRLPERWQIHYGSLTFNVKPMNFKHTGRFSRAGGKLGLHSGTDCRGGTPAPGAEPVCLYRRSDAGGRGRRGFGLPCGRRQRDGCLGKGKCEVFGLGGRADPVDCG